MKSRRAREPDVDGAKLLMGFLVDHRWARCAFCGTGATREYAAGRFACFDHWPGPVQLWFEFPTQRQRSEVMGTYISKRSVDLQKPIVDAKEPLVLEVKPVDVIRASDKNSKCCAFVRASEREIPGVQAAFFLRTAAFLEFDDKIVRYALPPSVQKEIVAFDRTKKMEPGTYQLSKPYPSDSRKALKKRDAKRVPGAKNKNVGTTKIKRGIVHHTQGIRSMNEPTYRSRP